MRIFALLVNLVILTIFYYIGVWIQDYFQLFIPGSIIGMLLLFLFLSTKLFKVYWIEAGASLLIRHLPLLFIPVTVGIINYLHIFSGQGILLVFIGLVSTFMAMVAAGMTSKLQVKRGDREYE